MTIAELHHALGEEIRKGNGKVKLFVRSPALTVLILTTQPSLYALEIHSFDAPETPRAVD